LNKIALHLEICLCVCVCVLLGVRAFLSLAGIRKVSKRNGSLAIKFTVSSLVLVLTFFFAFCYISQLNSIFVKRKGLGKPVVKFPH